MLLKIGAGTRITEHNVMGMTKSKLLFAQRHFSFKSSIRLFLYTLRYTQKKKYISEHTGEARHAVENKYPTVNKFFFKFSFLKSYVIIYILCSLENFYLLRKSSLKGKQRRQHACRKNTKSLNVKIVYFVNNYF